ncbi:hypothetical protein VULLAG_LOCUS2207 [Vulpes lagopus]|uniref:uncharacterized protein LOC121473584 isoform X1 n=1 Tax=Vulpes lagopus TaxID=494514 RepID=UPI001BC9B448|nr:uncharacterized protein LOC121473584 isoform X1 [Vulpes lagopus]XP_041582026.1 uncharacterized protein LOC121473584 isoform X1 [Vulpes lagopus]
MDAQVYPCLPAKNTSIPHPCCRPERKESGQFLKTSRGVTTVPVGSNIHSAFVLDTSTVFLGHCRLHTETAIGGGTGSGGAGRTWVHPCTEHAPPYTCAPRAPSPHPCSSKMPERFASGARARVAGTRPGGQASPPPTASRSAGGASASEDTSRWGSTTCRTVPHPHGEASLWAW